MFQSGSMRYLLRPGAVAAALLVSACSLWPGGGEKERSLKSSGVFTPTVAFNPADAAYVRQPGNAQVVGRAWLLQPTGEIRYGRRAKVDLMPVTPYSRQWIQAVFGEGNVSRRILKTDATYADFRKYVRQTVADEQGQFYFSRVPAGEYFVHAVVQWKQKGRYWPESGRVYRRVTVPASGTVQVNLNGEYDPNAPTM